MLDLVLQQLTNGVANGMSYALLALGLTLIFGVLHVINFAHGEMFMLGGGIAVLASQLLGVPYLLTIPVAAVGTGAAAWLIDKAAVGPLLDSKDGSTNVLLSTFAVSLLLLHGSLAAVGPAPRRLDGIPGTLELGGVAITWQRVAVVVLGIVLLLGVDATLRKTSLGKRIRAVSQSAFAARAVGIPVEQVRTVTFMGAGALAGIAGALMAPITLFTAHMGQHAVINAFVIVVLGGMGNPWGAVLCGVLLGVAEALLSIYLSAELSSAVIYTVLLAALLVRPQGIFTRAAGARY